MAEGTASQQRVYMLEGVSCWMLSCRQSYPWGITESLQAQPVLCTGVLLVLLVRHGIDQIEKQEEFAGSCLHFSTIFTRGCAELYHFPSHRKVLAPQKLNVPFRSQAPPGRENFWGPGSPRRTGFLSYFPCKLKTQESDGSQQTDEARAPLRTVS